MPSVTGPRGPSSTSTSSTTAPTATTTATPTEPLDLSLPQGWGAGTANRPAVNPNVSTPAPSAADIQATLPNPVRAAMQGSIDRFNARIESTLNHDAMSIARGAKPVREGDALTQTQQDALRSAAQDFVKELPLGALSPELASAVQQKLSDAGIQARDVASTRLGDLGRIGQDIAKDLVKDLKSNSPAAFYGLAAAGAVAIGTVGYTQGSAKLASLGIKPELKQKFFDDKLEVKLKGDWQAHFKDFSATATVGTHVSLGDAGRLNASVTANSRTGFESASVGYNYDRPNLNLSASATFNRDGLQNVGGSVVYRPNDDLRLSAGINHDFQANRTTANAEAAWRLSNNADLAISASHDSTGDSRIGAGVRVRF